MRSWLFQGNPTKYDVLGAIRNLRLDAWVVRHHARHIEPGDTVYIWKCGDQPGIYCAGAVRSVVGPQPGFANDAPYWRDESARPEQGAPRVLVSYDRKLLSPPLLRAQLHSPELGDLPNVRARSGTVFAVPEEQAFWIEMLLRSRAATGMLPPHPLDTEQFRAGRPDIQHGIHRDAGGHVSIRFEIGGASTYPNRWVRPGLALEYCGQGRGRGVDQTWNSDNMKLRSAAERQEPVSVFEAGRTRPLSYAPDLAPPQPEPALDSRPSVDVTPPARVATTTYRLLRDTELTKELKKAYGRRCQVCGYRMRLAGRRAYAEAHHIRPLGGQHKGLDVSGNIVVLCPNHHAAFDYGALCIEPVTHRVLHADQSDPVHGTQLHCRKDHPLDEASLTYARRHLFRG